MSSKEGKRLIKNSLMVLINNTVLMLGTWFISIWVARQLGPSNYGIYNLVLWVTGTFVWILGMGLIHATTKFIAEFKGKDEDKNCLPLILFIMKIEVVLSIPITILLLFFRSSISNFFFTPNESIYFLLAFIGIVPGILTAIFSATIEGIQKFEYFTISNLIITPLSFASKAYVLYTGKGIPGLMMVMLIFSFVNVAFYFCVLRREGMFKGRGTPLSKEVKGRISRYNRSVLLILMCDKVVWDKSENFFLGRYSSSVELGYYNLGYNLARKFVTILPLTFWKVLFPAMSGYFGSGDSRKMKKVFNLSTRYLAFFTFPIGAAGAILSFELIKYLYGYEFLGAQRVLQIIFIVSAITSLSQPGSAILYGYEKQQFIFKYGSILAVLNIVINFFLIRSFGALGAAFSYATISLMGSIGGLIYTCRTMKLNYPFVPLFKILFSTIIMSMVMVLTIEKDASVLGLAMSVSAGFITYLACSVSLGSFYPEDIALLNSAKAAFPGKSKLLIDLFISILSQLKNQNFQEEVNRSEFK
ncbi:hypothetical protein CHISP_2166 [Chitinispirillum alkaliphilum]|nr:hypothetical protein CHISP_2166 [Chitinispirillum alkaliphilum]